MIDDSSSLSCCSDDAYDAGQLGVFWGTMNVIRHLYVPFDAELDTFNVEAVLAKTERTMFSHLRAAWSLAECDSEPLVPPDLIAVPSYSDKV